MRSGGFDMTDGSRDFVQKSGGELRHSKIGKESWGRDCANKGRSVLRPYEEDPRADRLAPSAGWWDGVGERRARKKESAP
jgi:hypothetical protein